MLGIDEHFFTRKKGFATTLCDLHRHRVYDVVLGRSELSLRPIFRSWKANPRCGWCAWIWPPATARWSGSHFPNALIVADRFHVIRLVNHHFLNCWRELDPVGSKNRGLLSLMRRHRHNLRPDQLLRLAAYLAEYPALEVIYRFKQRLCYLLLKKHRTRQQCQVLIPRFLRALNQLRQAGLAQLVNSARRSPPGRQEIVAMWRFTRNNGITEGFHNKMEVINRQAYGFRNFQNYRLRVKVLCA